MLPEALVVPAERSTVEVSMLSRYSLLSKLQIPFLFFCSSVKEFHAFTSFQSSQFSQIITVYHRWSVFWHAGELFRLCVSAVWAEYCSWWRFAGIGCWLLLLEDVRPAREQVSKLSVRYFSKFTAFSGNFCQKRPVFEWNSSIPGSCEVAGEAFSKDVKKKRWELVLSVFHTSHQRASSKIRSFQTPLQQLP